MTAAPSNYRLADGYHALVTAERLTLRKGGRLFGAEDYWLRKFWYNHDNPARLTVEFLGHYSLFVDRIARADGLDASQLPQVQPELGLVTFVIDHITIEVDVNAATIAVMTDNLAALPDEYRRYFRLRRVP